MSTLERQHGSASPSSPLSLPAPSAAAVGSGLRAQAWWIAGGYAVVASLWILFSDQLLGLLISDPDDLVRYSSVKGVGFVVVTALLLLLLIRRSFARIADTYTDLQHQGSELRRLGCLYAALVTINQSIVRRPERSELFDDTCRALVDDGGFTMAWIGWNDTEAGLVRPVARHGDGSGYLDEVKVYTSDRPDGRGPSGTAIREQRPYICNDMITDPALAPWHGAVRTHGLRSVASVPFRLRGEICGVLNVYADEAHFFQAEEVDLLVEAAADISHALDNLADATLRAEAEATARAERMFSDTMIDSMPGVVYFYDTAGRFLRWNRNFEAISGYAHDEVAEMHPLEFFGIDDRPTVEARIAAVFETGEASVEASFVHKDGTATPYFFTGRRVEFDGRVCLVGVGIDITDRKLAERALQEVNQTLEHRVAERTGELRTALVRAEAADQIKSAFLATMSHELRTPLNSIIGFTGIVLQGLAGPLTDEQTKQLEMVRASARHLLALINDVLDISKIEAGQLEVSAEPFDLGDAIASATASIRPQVSSKALALDVECSNDLGTMIGDRRRVEQIVLNLLSNAVKFTERGSVTLSCRPVDDANGRPTVRLVVTDTGIGIAPDDLDQLFQPFRQIDSGITRQHEGTGLGLAICRRLATLMGGTVTATSTPGSGSEFTVVLPLNGPSMP